MLEILTANDLEGPAPCQCIMHKRRTNDPLSITRSAHVKKPVRIIGKKVSVKPTIRAVAEQ